MNDGELQAPVPRRVYRPTATTALLRSGLATVFLLPDDAYPFSTKAHRVIPPRPLGPVTRQVTRRCSENRHGLP